MITIMFDGKPAVYKHKCDIWSEGEPLTKEELRRFAVDVLVDAYEHTQAISDVQRLKQGADFSFKRYDTTINVLVVYDEDLEVDVSQCNSEWLLRRFEEAHEMPRIVVASATNAEGKDDVARGGDSFSFQFKVISLIDIDERTVGDDSRSDLELAKLFAQAWKTRDVELIKSCLDVQFSYTTDWMFGELPCRYEYLQYISYKFAHIAKAKSNIDVLVGQDEKTGDWGLIISNSYEIVSFLRLTCANGRIKAANMTICKNVKEYNAVDDLKQMHDGHLAAIMASGSLTIDDIDKVMDCSETHSRLHDPNDHETVIGEALTCGDEELRIMTVMKIDEEYDESYTQAIFPYADGYRHKVVIDEVLEWDGGVEATVKCHSGEYRFAFFATDYFCNKHKYAMGRTLPINLAAVGMEMRGQVHTDQSKVAYVPDDKLIDEVAFQSPVSKIGECSLFDTTFTICDINIKSEKDPCIVPLYVREDMCRDVAVGAPLSGVLWLMGEIDNDTFAYTPSEKIGGLVRVYADAVTAYYQRKRTFENLNFITDHLPNIKVRRGYELDAFCKCDDYGAMLQLYVCKKNSKKRWHPDAEDAVPYDDSMYIKDDYPAELVESVPPFLKYFTVPFTPDGILEAWLLTMSYKWLPLLWNVKNKPLSLCTRYNRIDVVTDLETLQRITHIDWDKIWVGHEALKAAKMAIRQFPLKDLLPRIKVKGDKGTLTYTYWNSYRGLVRETLNVMKKGKTVEFAMKGEKVLVPYTP